MVECPKDEFCFRKMIQKALNLLHRWLDHTYPGHTYYAVTKREVNYKKNIGQKNFKRYSVERKMRRRN
jgi:hypothetical protein